MLKKVSTYFSRFLTSFSLFFFLVFLPIFLLPFLIQGQVLHPYSRFYDASVLVLPGTSDIDFSTHIETIRHIKVASSGDLEESDDIDEAKKVSEWLQTNVIASFESYYYMSSVNLGLQASLGSRGLIAYFTTRWVPFPDINYQPALGIVADVFGGVSAHGDFISGVNVQALLAKKFLTGFKIISSIVPYFTPRFWIAPIPFNYNVDWILGIKSEVNVVSMNKRKFIFFVEGLFSTKQRSIGIGVLVPL